MKKRKSKPKRRYVQITVLVSLAPGVSKADAKKELRCRVNEACVWKHEEEDVRIKAFPASANYLR